MNSPRLFWSTSLQQSVLLYPLLKVIRPLARPELDDPRRRQPELHKGIFLHNGFHLLARVADRDNNSTGPRLLPAGDQKVAGGVILPQEGDVGSHLGVDRRQRGLVGEFDDEHGRNQDAM